MPLLRFRMLFLLLVLASLTGCMVKESTYLKKVDEANSLTGELTALKARHAALQADNAALRRDLETSADRIAILDGEAKRRQADLTGLEKILAARTDENSRTISQLLEKIAGLERENDTLKAELAALQKQKEEQVKEVSQTYEDLLEKMKSEISQGQVTISELKGKLTVNMVDAVLFDSGKAEVKPEGVTVLRKVLEILRQLKDKAIRIEGHTDNVQITGKLAQRFPTNWELSAARAITVARLLQQEGIDPTVLSAVAYGEYRPVAANDSEEGRSRNRRIEIILVPKE
jgi:chemotaxis protein MotB